MTWSATSIRHPASIRVDFRRWRSWCECRVLDSPPPPPRLPLLAQPCPYRHATNPSNPLRADRRTELVYVQQPPSPRRSATP